MIRDHARPVVYLVDEDPVFRDTLQWALERDGLRVECYAVAAELLTAQLDEGPGCIVLDVRFPGTSGLDAQQCLATRRIRLPIIMLTDHADVALAVDAMRAGAFDFLQKPVDLEHLLVRVRTAVLLDAQQRRVTAEHAHVSRCLGLLTPREAQVLDLIVGACSTKDIASMLHISPRTVDVHRAQILTKMEAASVTDLVRMVVAHRVGAAR